MRTHLVALDGKKQSQYAFEWYLNNVNRPGDHVVLFHCSSFELHVGLPGAAVNVEAVGKKVKEAIAQAESITQAGMDKIKERGLKAYVVIKSGMRPEDAILLTCEEEKVDQVFMGTRDLGSVQRAFVGSVSTAVARNAKVPVTIVKYPH